MGTRGSIRIERQKLYEQVWTTPMRKLAEDVGVSDVALAKVCKKLRVPRPPRGYWAQVKAGTAPRRPKLPKLKAGEADVVVMQPDRWRSAGPRTTREQCPEPPVIPVKPDLDGAHRLVRKTLTALRRGKEHERGIVAPKSASGVLDVRVSEGQRDRALRILDAVIRALPAYGGKLRVEEEKAKYGDVLITRTVVDIDGEILVVTMSEAAKRHDHVLTPEERAKGRDYCRFLAPKYDYEPSGRLTFGVGSGCTSRFRWRDGRKPLEERVGEIILGLKGAAQHEKDQRAEWRRWEEERRQQEHRRQEREKDREYDKGLHDDLHRMVDNWSRANSLRSFLAAAAEALPPQMWETPGVRAWFVWAEKQADFIDPLTCAADVPKMLTRERPRRFA